ncbi:hypothetical protein NAL32_02590 [Chryseobacterium sp. Ch-15]|uniref:Uncharacterized protein n=1 Tax=Chryseobacterium muglaense TaxID=2893752 RepID=A0A9Q3UW37_9FLAO|nr:hypothetical protein [Chryseobacterium muglaense]MCC9036154.1 hypothetical protein [Chryseobacterium muglaense]MCM2553271.1 hypothetical protein [Chryseobacterium muglaense]
MIDQQQSPNFSHHSKFVILSPFLIIAINIIISLVFGSLIGKWVFIPIILTEWCMFMFLILKYGGTYPIKRWLKKTNKNWGWDRGNNHYRNTSSTPIYKIQPPPNGLDHLDALDINSIDQPLDGRILLAGTFDRSHQEMEWSFLYTFQQYPFLIKSSGIRDPFRIIPWL